MRIQSSLNLGLALAASLLPQIARAEGTVLPPAASPSPLMSARTIQVHETLSRAGSDGTLPPAYSVDVAVQRPDKVKVVISYPGSTRVDQYVQEGKAEYQYDGANKNYRTSQFVDDKSISDGVRGITLVKLFLNGGQLDPPAAGARRTTTADTVKGRAMTLITETNPIKVPSDPTLKAVIQFWTDAKTRLPYRLLVTITQKGVAKPYQDVLFSGWVLDKPIPAAQLAWVPPPGAKLFQTDSDKLLAIGTPAPDFAALTPDGRTVHLSDYKGKTVVLDFWATWCGPCQRSMPHLAFVYNQVKDKNVAVLGLCVWDQKAAYDKWVVAKSKTFTFQTAFDPAVNQENSIASKLYHVAGIPTQYVIDKNGNVAAAYTGYNAGDTQLEKALAGLGVVLDAMPQKLPKAAHS